MRFLKGSRGKYPAPSGKGGPCALKSTKKKAGQLALYRKVDAASLDEQPAMLCVPEESSSGVLPFYRHGLCLLPLREVCSSF